MEETAIYRRMAMYTDREGRDFLIFASLGQVKCLLRRRNGFFVHTPNWDPFPAQTKATLLRIVWWLKLDLTPYPQVDPTRQGFRFYDKGGCGDCNGVYA